MLSYLGSVERKLINNYSYKLNMAGKEKILGNPPDGYQTITSYLVVHRPDDLIKFLSEAFGAVENVRFTSSNGTLTFSEVSVGGSVIMISEATASNPATPSNINVYVEDVDNIFEKAIKAGGSSVSDPEDKIHGERTGIVKDSTGNQWWISTQIEKLTADEIRKRAAEAEKN